jgi:hypothetical protein
VADFSEAQGPALAREYIDLEPGLLDCGVSQRTTRTNGVWVQLSLSTKRTLIELVRSALIHLLQRYLVGAHNLNANLLLHYGSRLFDSDANYRSWLDPSQAASNFKP